MKHLFKVFLDDIRKCDENIQIVNNKTAGTSQEVKVTAIDLFDELGRLFDKELKHSVTSQKGHHHH